MCAQVQGVLEHERGAALRGMSGQRAQNKLKGFCAYIE
jgi:hypothetical protein